MGTLCLPSLEASFILTGAGVLVLTEEIANPGYCFQKLRENISINFVLPAGERAALAIPMGFRRAGLAGTTRPW